MNLQACFFIIFLNVEIGAWRLFSQKYWNIEKSKSKLKMAKSDIEELEVFKRNSTNHTFLDEEEYMQLLRFYRPL